MCCQFKGISIPSTCRGFSQTVAGTTWAVFLVLLAGGTTLVLQGTWRQHSEPRYLIVHADDAGMCESVNRATREAMERGLVTSASIMVPCPAFEEFAVYAAAHPELDFGVHLVLNSEWETYRWKPLAPASQVPSLTDSDGYFWRSRRLVALNVKAAEAEIELRAQIGRAKARGIRISHLDSHMLALFTRPDLARLYLKLAVEYDLPILTPRHLAASQADALPDVAAVCSELAGRLDARQLPLVDHWEDNYGVPVELRRHYFLNCVRQLKPGVTQIVIHCGYDDRELRDITSSAPLRDGDRELFTSHEMAREIDVQGIVLSDWTTMKALRRRQSLDTRRHELHYPLD